MPDIFLSLYLLLHLIRAKWRKVRRRRETTRLTGPLEGEGPAGQEKKASQENVIWMIVAVGIYVILHKVVGSKDILLEKRKKF